MKVVHQLAFTGVALALAAPATAANTTLTSLTESQAFPAIQSTIKYNRESATKTSGFGNYARATSTVRYDKATNSYIVRDTGNIGLTSTFDLDNKDVGQSSVQFTVVNKGPNESLRIYNPGATTQGIALTYTGYGQWRRTGTPQFGTGTAVNDTYFVYGIKTPASQIATGSATYTTALDGTFTNKDGAYKVSGNGTMSANFTGHSIAYSATPVGARESDSAPLVFGAVSGTGTIATAASLFRGTGTPNGNGYRMDVSGYFFGPSAAEVGGVFRLYGNGGNGQGAMVGKQP